MKEEITVRRQFRHGIRVFEVGEVGEIVHVEHQPTFVGKPIWDLFVKFPGHEPVGVHESEVQR